jgi:hypothetical protein
MEILFFLLVFLTIITLIGHGIWVAVRAFIRLLLRDSNDEKTDDGVTRLFEPVAGPLNDLAATERQLVRFYRDGKINDETYELLMARIRAERDRVLGRPTPAPPKPAPVPRPTPPPPAPVQPPPSVVTASVVATDEEIIIKPVPTFIAPEEPASVPVAPVVRRPVQPPPPPPPPRKRRPFSEVLNSFMEESNIRWGEIIGGLLIIGCSTALVVSLWAQISEIPVLKFLIFTTVTAILFGIGLYTEHRWKLPTTSRGILTIATLLVPLNFLAIAAVSAGNTSGALVIGSELLAPAIFLCLVYFAGRVITPDCAHILSAGVLGSSIGQLLVRHFAEVDTSSALLILLGAFPVCCYVATVGLALRVVLADRDIDASETTTVFTVLGTMSFAALLPFGLLLYKSGPLGMSMMYLAPLVTLWGLPMLATGTILWRRISNKELVASRTTGTALGILGVMIVLAGMILAWPNPASIVPAALLNFAVFTVLALALELPVAHLIAAICFALAYLVTSHVLAGNITWQNLRVMSLLEVSLSVGSGEALVGAFALFLIASEWLSQRKREGDSHYYLVSACLIAIVSLLLATVFGFTSAEYAPLWIVYGIYSLGAFWVAWRRRLSPFAWAGSALLLFSLAHNFAHATEFAFPWQTALFAHATICALAAIVCLRYERGKILSAPLNNTALISIVFGVICLFQANTWEVTWMQAQRVFWIAGILLLLLWLNRRRVLLNTFQIALLCALVLTVKASLQEFAWYSYLPHAFLHPAALQIQGTVLALFCLGWIALRFVVKGALPKQSLASWWTDAWGLLDTEYSIDRFISWLLPVAFLMLAMYGALSGLIQELAAWGSSYRGFNVAEFPHQEALGAGSWIVLGLMLLMMLANFWERRRRIYLLGALVVFSAVIPLLAGQFENQGATATAFRWLAAIFLLAGSVVLWYRNAISKRLATLGLPEFNGDLFITGARALLISLAFAPLFLFTIIPALRAILDLPVQLPASGFFSLFDESVLYGFPLVVTAFVLIGHALRERMPTFAFGAGAIFNATVTLVFLLAVGAAHGPMDRVVLVRLVQLNILTLAVYSLPWLSTRARWQVGLNQKGQKGADYLLKLQLTLALAAGIVLFIPVTASLIIFPENVGIGTTATGSFLGWLAFFAVVINATWLAASRVIRIPAFAFAALLFGLSCLIGFSASSINGWVGLHTLTVCTTVTAWLLLRSHPRSSAFIGSLAVSLSLRTLADAQISHWWSVGPLLALTALAATLNWRTLQRRYIFAAGILFNLTVSVWWIFALDQFFPDQFFLINLVAASLAGMLWLWLELRSRRLNQPATSLRNAFAFHNLAAVTSLVLLALFVVLSSMVGPRWSPVIASPRLTWLTFLSLLMFMTACLWDRYARYAVAGLYTLGLLGGDIALQQLKLSSTQFTWSAMISLAVYTLLTTLLWHWRGQLIDFAKRFGVPERIDRDTKELVWLSVYSVLAVAAAAGLAYWINVTFVDFDLRISAALAVAAQCVALALLAEGRGEKHWRRGAIAVFVIGAILMGWSWVTPGINASWLNRSVILMVETFGLTALYGLWLDKANARWPNWTDAARACVPWMLGAGTLALFFCLATEVSYQLKFGAVLVNPFSLVAVGVTLVASVVICVLFALSPNHDPLSLSERGRMRYVYVAEVMLALLFLHIRLTMPWLFTGFIERYWPLVVMLIAYFGVTTSEALRRRKLLVLAQPLERTGAFLPLLPVLGFWLASSEVDFSLLLFAVGGLYGLLSILRRSFGFGLLAAVAGNAGLWYVWQRTADFQFLQHPQLWLIPIALSVLLAAYLNEEKLTEDQMAGVRYLSLVTIYVSSTSDIFINGVANSPWLPLILGSFSLAGVFAGIIFRIRGLLLLGSIFLLLSIVTMIWYASANFGWTWLWYVAGIVTGATIIFMFALFEKKRSEVLRVVEGLKEWER